MATDDALREIIRNEFGHVNRRLDDMCELAVERHTAVVAEVRDVRADVRMVSMTTNSHGLELARQGRDIKTLFSRVGGERGRLVFYGTLIVGGATGIAWLIQLVKGLL